jgi:uncharacterized repeat protein (TIGR03806 family)
VIVDYTGTLHQLEPTPKPDPNKPAPAFPRLLSQTGLFASTKDHQPAPGVIPYSVNSPLWSDGAEKQRFLAIPGEAKIEYHPTETWKFPEGTVLVKTFAMDMERGNPASLRRLETRLLHLEQDHWRGYTYVWNKAQSDAELLDRAGRDERLLIHEHDVPGRSQQQTWRYPSRAECTLCHTMPAKFVLGVNTPQLNRQHNYDGVEADQLATLDHLGLFTKPIASYHTAKDAKGVESPAALPALADPHDTSADLEARARSYLHANCAHCHVRWGGGNALFQLTWTLPLGATGLIDTPPMHGDHGAKDARLLVPGDPSRSLLWTRMTKTGQGRMPHVGSNVPDTDAVKLIKAWIEGLQR